MENYIVYEHINKINFKKYIGITKQAPEKRWNNGNGYSSSPHFYQAIQKYGWNNFEHLILFSNLSKEEAFQKEIELIEQYHTTNPSFGYNIAKGGQTGPRNFSKMTEFQRTHKKFGEDNVNSKKVQCIETGDIFGSIKEAERWSGSNKIGLVCNGKREHAGKHPITKEPLTWRYIDDKEKVTIICHQRTQEKKKIKKIKCIETNEIFNSAAEAGRKYNITPCNILRVCKKLRQTAGKKHWEYIEE